MKKTDTISKVIMIYWIIMLSIAAFYSVESFYNFFTGNENFSYRIILRSFTLIAVFYGLISLLIGLFKDVEYSKPVLAIVTKFSYLVAVLGLTFLVMHLFNVIDAPIAYPVAGVFGLIALSGYLSNLWFKKASPMAAVK